MEDKKETVKMGQSNKRKSKNRKKERTGGEKETTAFKNKTNIYSIYVLRYTRILYFVLLHTLHASTKPSKDHKLEMEEVK